jgi:hypothetical protein
VGALRSVCGNVGERKRTGRGTEAWRQMSCTHLVAWLADHVPAQLVAGVESTKETTDIEFGEDHHEHGGEERVWVDDAGDDDAEGTECGSATRP